MKTKIIAAIRSTLLLISCCLLFTISAAAYSNDELCEMARQFCKARGDYVPQYFIVDIENGNSVTIHLFDIVRDGETSSHTATSDWYEVDRNTGRGTDFFGKAIDLSPYAPSKPANSEFTIQNGVLIKYNGSGGDVVIPSTVKEIAHEAFWNIELTSISIPNSVTKIEWDAFGHCYGLKDLTIPNSVTVIEDLAFEGLGVNNIIIGSGVTRIGDAAFEGARVKNVTILHGVKAIGAHVFRNCENLKSITIPSSVTDIGTMAFSMIDGSLDCGIIPGLTIYGAAGSFAERYAAANGILFQPSGAVSRFTDVPANAYYAAAVDWAVNRQITSGTSSTTFSPGKTCTINEILTFLCRANENSSSSNILAWASQRKLIDSSNVDLSEPCTRSTAVTYLWKMSGSPSVNRSTNFVDVPVNAGYSQAVSWAVQRGITSGTSTNTFSPKQTCTRGQIVTLLYNYFS